MQPHSRVMTFLSRHTLCVVHPFLHLSFHYRLGDFSRGDGEDKGAEEGLSTFSRFLGGIVDYWPQHIWYILISGPAVLLGNIRNSELEMAQSLGRKPKAARGGVTPCPLVVTEMFYPTVDDALRGSDYVYCMYPPYTGLILHLNRHFFTVENRCVFANHALTDWLNQI